MSDKEPDVTYQIRLPVSLLAQLKDTAAAEGMSQSELARQALKRGLPMFQKALSLTPEQLAGIPDATPQAAATALAG